MYEIVVIGNPTFTLSNDKRQLSGPSVYTATSATRIGIEQLAIVGSVRESFRTEFIQSIDALSIPEYYIIPDTEENAFSVRISEQQEVLGTRHNIGIRDIPEEFLQANAIVLCPSLQEINSELVEWICNSSDSQIYLKPRLQTVGSEGQMEYVKNLNLMEKTHCFIDVFQPNEQEARLITGESDPFVAAELLVEWTTEVCVVTMGKKGSLIYDGSEYIVIPSHNSDIVDPLGAGSVYLSGFAAQYLKENSLVECGAYATALASIKVEYKGLDFHIDQNVLNQRMESISDAIDIR